MAQGIQTYVHTYTKTCYTVVYYVLYNDVINLVGSHFVLLLSPYLWTVPVDRPGIYQTLAGCHACEVQG